METSISIGEAPAIPETHQDDPCRHQWLIEAPAGPSSTGACRLCGEERQFRNYIEGSSWGYDVSVEQLSGASRPAVSGDNRDKIELAENG